MRDFFEIAVLDPMRRLYEQLVLFVPKLLGLLFLSFVGLFLGWVAFRIVRRSLAAVKFDKFCSQLGLATILDKGNIRKPASELVASGIYWLIVISFFMIGLRTLDESIMEGVFSRFFAFVTNLVVVIFFFFMCFVVFEL